VVFASQLTRLVSYHRAPQHTNSSQLQPVTVIAQLLCIYRGGGNILEYLFLAYKISFAFKLFDAVKSQRYRPTMNNKIDQSKNTFEEIEYFYPDDL
jgi:hypothetical protein